MPLIAEKPNVSAEARYSVTEACKIMGIHKNTLHRWVKKGLINAGFRKSTGKMFISGTEIDKFWKQEI